MKRVSLIEDWEQNSFVGRINKLITNFDKDGWELHDVKFSTPHRERFSALLIFAKDNDRNQKRAENSTR